MKKYVSRLIAGLLALTMLAAPASALSVSDALELLEDNYYYDIPDEAYEAKTLNELFRLLGDPYTEYMTEEQYAAFMDSVEATVDMVGIGVEIQYTGEGMLIRDVLSGGSALKAGLQPGDLIVAVDGVSCAPAGEENREMLLGAKGTRVTVTVLRDGQTQDYRLTRRAVHIPNTEISVLDGGIGYVDCNSFGTDTDELFADGLKRYDDQVDFWLVDLRDNAGGVVDSALEMVAAVNGPGCYIYFEDYAGRVIGYDGRSTAVTSKPMILLVNGLSASSSELLASNLRDTDRGIIIGSRTFGKGIAQTVLDEASDPDYFDGDCLKITTARFYAAGGTATDKIGVIPTLLVDDGYTEAVAAALCGGDVQTSKLCVIPGTEPFYVDPDTSEEVLSVLLEAIPPQMPLFCSDGQGGNFDGCTPAEAADRLGLSFDSRWFTDAADSFYSSAINAMGTYRLLNGTDPGVFSPKERITRAQLCVMLARALNVATFGYSRFSDVPADAWYAGAVTAVAELGLVTGVGDGQFDPNGALTQEEFLTIMGRTARYLNFALDNFGETVADPAIILPQDMQQGLSPYRSWARGNVAVLAWGLEDTLGGSGSMLYTSLKNITPSDFVLREEAAAGIYRVLAGLELIP